MGEQGARETHDLVHFSVGDLPSRGYGVMGEIRRQGNSENCPAGSYSNSRLVYTLPLVSDQTLTG
uniref:Uncharacterized protein n=1 Tax=Salvator merianae TaxID=96440 RepID=A0A8D0DU99_SALMN